MRAWLLVLTSGCGRVGFDELSAPSPTIDAPAIDSGPLVCPSRYVGVGAGCYRFPTSDEGAPDLGWLDAEADCEVDGGHLVVFETSAEVMRIAGERTTVSYWIGISDRVVNNTYAWVTGVAAPLPAPFAANEPDPMNLESCIQFDETLGVSDELCAGVLDDYICEFDGRPADPSTF